MQRLYPVTQLKMMCFFALLVAATAVTVGAVSVARDTCGTSVVPLYRMYNGAAFDHFYTTSASEVITAVENDGYVLEGVSAAVFPTQQGTTLPLYRLYSAGAHDHFYTSVANRDSAPAVAFTDEMNHRTNPVERDFFTTNNGYKWEGTAALVYTTQICGSVPLYRLYAASHVDHFYTTSATERASALALGFIDEGIVAYVPAKGIVTGDSV
ncbi:hypothetical protein MVEN_01159000 [Mycena venus]|uniref:DUF5648 domain-containing protein n=1 Tax=Mycena venus TaxID=2733690 RepID=A0A8H7CVF7_9AGAR|nr:hypothetical protein MVEN_01159000 [Mycena venus]